LNEKISDRGDTVDGSKSELPSLQLAMACHLPVSGFSSRKPLHQLNHATEFHHKETRLDVPRYGLNRKPLTGEMTHEVKSRLEMRSHLLFFFWKGRAELFAKSHKWTWPKSTTTKNRDNISILQGISSSTMAEGDSRNLQDLGLIQ